MTISYASDRPETALDIGQLAAFVCGLAIAVEMSVVGRIMGTELLLMAAAPVLIATKGRRLAEPLIRPLLILAVAWMLAQAVSDAVNQSTLDNAMRGAARGGVTLLLVGGLFLLLDGQLRRARWLVVGLCTGLIIKSWYSPGELAEEYPWKFGVGTPLSLLGLMTAGWIWRQGGLLASVLLVAGLVGVNLVLGYRSMAGVCLVSGAVMAFNGMLQRAGAPARSLRGNLWLVGVLFLASIAAVDLYQSLARGGLLGHAEFEKYELQAGPLGVLLSGRMEILVSSEAILERPLLGHGSWPESDYYANLLFLLAGGESWDGGGPASALLPTHSHLFGAWVEAGIAGGLFWFAVLVILLKATLAAMREHDLIDAGLVGLIGLAVWSVPFSPYGAENRPMTCAALVIAVLFLHEARQRQTERFHVVSDDEQACSSAAARN